MLGRTRDGGGHAAIVANEHVFNDAGNEFTLDVWSTGVGDFYEYGMKSYTFQQNSEGKWIDIGSNQLLSGFGQIDEEGINNSMEKLQPKNIESLPTEDSRVEVSF